LVVEDMRQSYPFPYNRVDNRADIRVVVVVDNCYRLGFDKLVDKQPQQGLVEGLARTLGQTFWLFFC